MQLPKPSRSERKPIPYTCVAPNLSLALVHASNNFGINLGFFNKHFYTLKHLHVCTSIASLNHHSRISFGKGSLSFFLRMRITATGRATNKV